MNWQAWLTTDWQQLLGIALSAVIAYSSIIAFTRLMGLRSFSKLSGYDFAMTVAMGSILASTIVSQSPALLQGVFAMAMLFILQAIVSLLSRKFTALKKVVDNQAIILMANGNYVWHNLKQADLTKSDVQKILRKNGIKAKSEVFAVIMETTGNMSVIKHSDQLPDRDLFDDIRDSDLLFDTVKNTDELASRIREGVRIDKITQ